MGVRQVSILLRTGEVEVREVPPPILPENGALVTVRASVVSSGTEQAKVDVGKQSLVGKARSRPDAVQQTIDVVRSEGLKSAAQLVKARLDSPQEIGYSCSGVVDQVGRYGGEVRPGQRVACAGGGYANHASVVAVPRNLMARVPETVNDEAAAYATVGAVALHGLHQGECRLGERVLVVGLGLIGQLACQLAAAAGAIVHGVDPDAAKAELAAETAGAVTAASLPELESAMGSAPQERFDLVLVTASSKSNAPIQTASYAVRDRGRVVVVGDVGLELDRTPFYEKEVELRFSRSYGPGRYDPLYEQRGVDYPMGYVRWTVQRNMESFLEACARGVVDPMALTTHRFGVEEAGRAYETLVDSDVTTVGVVLEYPADEKAREIRVGEPTVQHREVGGAIRVGVVGTGRYATRHLLPALSEIDGVELVAVAGERGLSSEKVAERYQVNVERGLDGVLARGDVDALVIATRHDTHARLAAEALRAGRNVFVEKPLVRVEEELDDLLDAYSSSGAVCMVGFNRRYAPATAALKNALSGVSGPSQVLIRVNAGRLEGHWLTDPEIGGGRLIGEGCHFVDLANHLIGHAPSGANATGIPGGPDGPSGAESFSINLDYPDGSIATIVYTALGDRKLPKERVEVHRGGLSAVIDDFRRWHIWQGGKESTGGSRASDKGQRNELAAFASACRGESTPHPVSFRNDLITTLATLAALRSLGTATRMEVRGVDV